MKVCTVDNIHFNGRIKSGDLNRALSTGYKRAKASIENFDANTERIINKTFDNPENPTLKDYLKMTVTASSSGVGSTASSGLTTTTKADLWSVFSSIFPSLF